jgi:hypothetical protein
LQERWKTEPPEDKSFIDFYLTVDNYVLSQIEKIRRGNNLSMEFLLQFRAFIEGNPATIQPYKMPLQGITIPKSIWIEDVLPRLNYKNVALVEIPKLEYEKLNEAVSALNLEKLFDG